MSDHQDPMNKGLYQPYFAGLEDHYELPSVERRRAGKIAEYTLMSCLAFFFAFGIVCIAARSLDHQSTIQQEEMYPLSSELEELSRS